MELLRSALARPTLPLLVALFCVVAASGALTGVQADTNSPPGADQLPPTTDQLPAPTGLSATSAQTSIKLTWNPVPGARYYDLYRDRSISGVVSAPVTTFTFGLKCATSYRLEVDARNESARSPLAGLTASTSACTDPPARVPSISGFTPTSGPVETSVTVSGSAFTGATAVKFNGTSANYTVSSDTQISATVPAGATSGPIAVTGPAGTGQSSSSFTVTSSTKPSVSGFKPTSGPAGTSVTVTGSGFTGATAVKFNGTSANYTVSSDTQISATVPAGATSGPIAVTTPGGWAASSASFTVTTTAPPPTGTGTVFVAPPSSAGLGTSGSDSDATNCKRLAAGVSVPPGGAGHGCATFQTAYQLAQPGDVVYLGWNGSWPIQLGIGPSGNKTSTQGCNYPTDTSGCINFTPAPGMTPSLTSSGTSVAALKICANNVELSNITFNQHTYTDSFGDTVTSTTWAVGTGDSTCMPSSAPPHDVFIKNVVSNGQAAVVGGSSHVYVLGGAIQNARDAVPQFGGTGNNGATAPVHDNTIDGVTFTNIYGDDSAHHHMECLHLDYGADSITIKNSSFVACKTGPAGPVYSIRFETDASGSAATNNLVENNVIDQSAPISFNCHASNCAVTGNTVRFNTVTASGSALTFTNDCALVGGLTCNVSGNLFYGNLVAGSCPSNAVIYAAGWNASYNVWSGTGASNTICSGDTTSAFNATINVTGSSDVLANCTQMASNFVPPQKIPGIPTRDIVGNARPKNLVADAGANENC